MGIVINPDSEYAKELARWDTPRSLGGMRPDGFELYPRMVYLAIARQGKAEVGDPRDEQFSASCQRIVRNEAEYERARRDGWRETPTAALAYYEGLQLDISTAAAEANAAALAMTPKAQADRARRDKATDKHVPE